MLLNNVNIGVKARFFRQNIRQCLDELNLGAT